MVEESFSIDDVLHAIGNGRIIEHYPAHPRGGCCLLFGTTASGRPAHIVCTTTRPLLIVITVYEPAPPKWPTPTRRRQSE